MGEIKKGNHIMKLFNWLRGLFRREAVHVFRKPCKLEVWAEQDLDINEFERFTVNVGDLDLKLLYRQVWLEEEIARLRRNKKKHSHLQKELDALINSGADTQTNKMENVK